MSGASPYPADCNPPGGEAQLFLGSEVEPHLAIGPADPCHLVAAWQLDRLNGGGASGTGAAASFDGGRTWSTPARANAVGGMPAFTPSLAVDGSGRVGLGYSDWRDPPTGSGPGLWTTRWLATSTDGGASWTETAAGGPFDLRRAPAVPGLFLGDYQGLVAGPDGFTSLFAMPPLEDLAEPAEVFAGPPQPGP